MKNKIPNRKTAIGKHTLSLFTLTVLALQIYGCSIFPSNPVVTASPVSSLFYYIQTHILKQDIFEGYIKSEQLNIDVLHYKVNIDLYPLEKIIKGDVTVTGRFISGGRNEVCLNFYDNLTIDSLSVNGKSARYDRDDKHITIIMPEKRDTFSVRIIYKGTPHRGGFSSFSFDEFDKKPVVYTLNEPVYASTWLPCNDRPDDKALADIYITNDSSMVSVSNGRLSDISISGSRKTYHWSVKYPISTYLITLNSADYSILRQQYVSTQKDTMDLLYFAFPKHKEMAKYDFSIHPELIGFFAGLFGEYPFIKEKYGVVEFLWQAGAMEHQTITAIGSNFVSGKGFFADFLIHELAHQWWGDAVGPKSWNDIWLNEGFASYCEALYAEHQGGNEALRAVMSQKHQDDFPGTLYAPKGDLFNETVYDKGAWVVHMLRMQLGDEVFFKILRRYFEAYKYSNASTEDFRRICEEVSGRDMKQFFRQWVYDGKGIIELRYSWRNMKTSEGLRVEISVEQVQDGYDTYVFPLELDIKLKGTGESVRKILYIDSREKSVVYSLSAKAAEVKPDPEDKLLMRIIK